MHHRRAARNTARSEGFRPDIEGLRAVAVVAVLLYHAHLPLVSGGYVGVDVFFVISGYLITGLLLRELREHGTISLGRFYARRIKRLLPAAVTVLAVTAILARILRSFSDVRGKPVYGDVIAAGVYVVNWRLAARAVSYLQEGIDASPVQHFWSLAVEEQFYLVWPALLLIATWWIRRRGERHYPALWVAVAAVGTISFAYGVHVTDQNAAWAYFSTLARGWEFALGGVLAAAPVGRLRLPPLLCGLLGWAGLGMIVASALEYDAGTNFPGLSALLPALGAAAIILAGSTARPMPLRPLTARPVRAIGRVSYSWYLWHWPLLVFARAQWGHLGTAVGLGVVTFSVIPAWATYRYIEQPLRHAPALTGRPFRSFSLGAACSCIAVALGMLLPLTVHPLPLASNQQVKGAADLPHEATPESSVHKIRPQPEDAGDDRGQMHKDGCLLSRDQTQSPPCVYGDTGSDTTVVLLGDSHAMQFFPALDRVAKKRHWRIVGLTKSGCTPADVATYNGSFKRAYNECVTWRDRAIDRIEHKEHPSLIVVSSLARYAAMQHGHELSGHENTQALIDGYVRTLRTLRGTGAEVVTIRDTPDPHEDVPDCVATNAHDLAKCTFSRSKAYSYTAIGKKAAAQVDGVRLIDPQSVICPHPTCPVVTGNALVYRNGGHLTATYARTLSDWLGRRLPHLK